MLRNLSLPESIWLILWAIGGTFAFRGVRRASRDLAYVRKSQRRYLEVSFKKDVATARFRLFLCVVALGIGVLAGLEPVNATEPASTILLVLFFVFPTYIIFRGVYDEITRNRVLLEFEKHMRRSDDPVVAPPEIVGETSE